MRDGCIFMFVDGRGPSSQPRHKLTSPRTANLNFLGFLPRSAVAPRPPAGWGPSSPEGPRPKTRDPSRKLRLRLGLQYFRGLSVPNHCAHGRTALRLPGAKGSSERSTRIDQRQICATRTSGCSCITVGVVV